MAKLAALGGSRVINESDIAHNKYPEIDNKEHDWINRALKSGRLWGPWGEITKKLENTWANKVGTDYCSAVNSGTAALHCAVIGCGIMPGDEVIVPAYTFIGSITGILLAGAIPIFADVDLNTSNIDPSSVKKYITRNTKGILVVHLHGSPANMKELLDLAEIHSLKIIEDCSQAHGANYFGNQVGGLGDVGAFSLNATKLLAGPEGGLITSNSEDIINKAAKARVFGVEHVNGKAVVRNTDSFGFSYRTNELMSAFALARLESFDKESSNRINNANRFINGIKELRGIQPPVIEDGCTHVFQMLRLRLFPEEIGLDISPSDFREKLLVALEAEGAFWWTWETKPLPEYDVFKTKNELGGGIPWTFSEKGRSVEYDYRNFPNSLSVANSTIYTSSHFPPNSLELMDLYVKAFHKIWENIHEVLMIDIEPKTDILEDFT